MNFIIKRNKSQNQIIFYNLFDVLIKKYHFGIPFNYQGNYMCKNMKNYNLKLIFYIIENEMLFYLTKEHNFNRFENVELILNTNNHLEIINVVDDIHNKYRISKLKRILEENWKH